MRTFFKTVAIVTVFSVCEKFLGFLYRVYMSRTIGAEGVGLYQVALSIFGFILTVICSGTPVTVSRLMTKYKTENSPVKVKRVISSGLFYAVAVSLPVCILLYSFPSVMGIAFSDKRCLDIFYVILPSLVFTSVYSVLRGVFWGNKDFLPYSVIELLEEICMIITGIALIGLSKDVFVGAKYAGVAVLVSFVFSFSLAVTVFFIRKNRLTNPFYEFKSLVASSTPVTAMRTVNSLAVSLVSVILPLRLVASGYTNSEAMSLFGSAMGEAIPILFIPTSLIGSFTLVLIPEVSENFYGKKYYYLKCDVEKAIRFTVLLTCVFIPLFAVLGEEIGVLIFDSYECGEYLSLSAFLMLFIGLSNVTTSILNSIGLETKTLLYSMISGVFMLLSIWFLPSVVGIYSLLIGFSFVYGLTTLLNLILLYKNCPIKPEIKSFSIKCVLCVLPTAVLGFMLEKLLLHLLGTFVTFLLCSAVLLTFIGFMYVGFGLINVDDIKKNLPKRFPFVKKRKSFAKPL